MKNNLEQIPSLEDANRMIATFKNILEPLTPDLPYKGSNFHDDKEAKAYANEWKSGIYKLSSANDFLTMRYHTLYSESDIGKKARNNRLSLYNFLLKEESFKTEISNARKKLGIDYLQLEQQNLTNEGEAIDLLAAQMKPFDANRITSATNEIVKKYCLDSDIWYPIILCQIASPNGFHEDVVKTSHKQSSVKIEVDLGYFTVHIPYDFSRNEINILYKVLRDFYRSLPSQGAKDIWDYVIADREAGLSWHKLEKKYGIPTDNLREHIRRSGNNTPNNTQ